MIARVRWLASGKTFAKCRKSRVIGKFAGRELKFPKTPFFDRLGLPLRPTGETESMGGMGTRKAIRLWLTVVRVVAFSLLIVWTVYDVSFHTGHKWEIALIPFYAFMVWAFLKSYRSNQMG